MSTRWLIRLVVLVSVLLLGAMADAQQSRGGGATPTPAPAGGGGASGGGARAPAPAPAPRAAPSPAPTRGSGNTAGGSSGTPSGSGTSTPPTNNGSGGSVTTGTGSAISGTGSAISSTPAPITQTPAPTMGNRTNPPTNSTRQDQQDQQGRRRHHPRNPNDPNRPNNNGPTYVLPQQYGWAPYTWWYNGNSAWMPSVLTDGYYDNGYYGDGDRAADDYNDNRYDRVAPPPAPPTPSPAQEEARAANAMQGMPAYNQAMVEFKSAQAAYDDAVARVMGRLRQDPQYRQLVAQRDRAEDRVEAVQAGARIEPNAGRVLPAAQQKLQVSSKITKMEQDAIAADPQASAAKARLVEANEKLTALRKQAGASGAQAR